MDTCFIGQNRDNTGSADKMAATISDGAAPTSTDSIAVTPERPKISEYEAALLKEIARMKAEIKRQRRVYNLKLREYLASKRRLKMNQRRVRRAEHRFQRRVQQMNWCKLSKTHDAEDDGGDDTEDEDGDEDNERIEEQIKDHQAGTTP